MKVLLRSNYSLIAGVLALFISLMIFTGFLTSALSLKEVSSTIGKAVEWEIYLANTTHPYNELTGEVNITLDYLRVLPEELKQARDEVQKENAYVRYSWAIQAISPYSYAFRETSNCSVDPMLLNFFSILVIDGINLSTSYIIKSSGRPAIGWEDLSSFLNLTFIPPDDRTDSMLDSFIKYGQTAEVVVSTPLTSYGYTENIGFRYSSWYIVTDTKHVQDLVIPLLHSLNKTLLRCGYGLHLKASWTVVTIDLIPESYFNPASISSTLTKIGEVANDLKNKLNYQYAWTSEAQNKLSGFSALESTMSFSLISGLIPAIIAILVAITPLAESAVLSVRESIGLVRLRGSPSRKLKIWIFTASGVAAVAGVLLAVGVLPLISLGLGRFSGDVIRSILGDPVIWSAVIVLVAISTIFLSHKAYKISISLPPRDSIKSSLTPEELLEPLRMRKLAWFSLFTGLYFVVTGFLGFSAQKILVEGLIGGSLGSNIGILVGVVILATFENFFRPFAPVLLAYGVAKYVMVHNDKFISGLTTHVFRSGSLSIPAKGISLAMRRRVNAIIMLLIFSLAILSQGYISSAYRASALETATYGSIGAEYLAIKRVYITQPYELKELASKYEELYGNVSSIVISIVAPAKCIPSESEEYSTVASFITILNIDAFLNRTFWFREWGEGESFDAIIEGLSERGDAIFISRETFFGQGLLEKGDQVNVYLSLGNTSNAITLNISGVSKGFPGMPSLAPESEVFIVGPWFLEMYSKLMEGGNDQVSFASVGIFVNDSSVAEKLRNDNFKIISMKDVRNDPMYKISSSLFVSGVSSTVTTTSLIGLSIFIAVIIAWAVSREIRKIFLLLRVRGVSSKSISKIVVFQWASVALLSVIVGTLCGISFGMSEASSLQLGATLTQGFIFMTSQLIDLGMGVPKFSLPLEMVVSSIIVIIILTLLPSIVTLRVYRGSIRERFIEVR